MERKMNRERIRKIILILVMTVLLVFICAGCRAWHFNERQRGVLYEKVGKN